MIPCKTIVVATGTFLGGEAHIGLEVTPFGRLGEPASHSLSESLREAGFVLARLKTGTPPRLDKRSIDYTGLQEQKGDVPASPFGFLTDRVANEVRLPCWLSARLALIQVVSRTTRCRASRPRRTRPRTRSCRRTCTSRSTSARRSKVRPPALPSSFSSHPILTGLIRFQARGTALQSRARSLGSATS